MSAVKITNNNFTQEVKNSDKTVLLDFWAPWCGPCRMLGPIIDQVAEETINEVKVGKINVDDEPELAEAFRVMSIPTLVVIKNGKIVNSSVGVKSKEAILSMLR